MTSMEAPALAQWESFYVIVGSSAAALTGLQFVVIALIADSERRRGSPEIAAFGTPTVLHFCSALFAAAVISAPWHSLSSAAIALGLGAAAGLVYALNVIRRARRQSAYRLVAEDWLWYISLPVVAYATLLGGAACLPQHAESALFAIAGAVLLLVFIGIHNAWDTVTFIAIRQSEPGAP
jgi:hypothetical protein